VVGGYVGDDGVVERNDLQVSFSERLTSQLASKTNLLLMDCILGQNYRSFDLIATSTLRLWNGVSLVFLVGIVRLVVVLWKIDRHLFLFEQTCKPEDHHLIYTLYKPTQ